MTRSDQICQWATDMNRGTRIPVTAVKAENSTSKAENSSFICIPIPKTHNWTRNEQKIDGYTL